VTLYTDIKLEQLIEESINNSEIDLDGKQLIDHDMDVVYKKAILEKKCTKLRLQKNKITGKGATILANALYNNTTLTELYLSKNKISDIGVHSLAQTLSINNFTLKLLDLHSNNITDEGVEYLAEMLKINKTIIRLGLGFNQISDQGVRLLANTITHYNENLQWLSLSSNRLISDESLPSLIEMLTHNPSLKTLWLNDCNLSTNAATRLKQKVATNENFILEV
jgi:Ran GTPase-activating protein (RanGAP) involved in mRNA processing and transport